MSWPGRSTSPITAGAIGSAPFDRVLLADDEDLLVLQEDARLVEVADAELRALEVGDQRERLAGLLLNLADDAGTRGVVFLRAVREIEADRVDPGLDQLAQHVVARRHRPDRRDDLRSPALRCHLAPA